MITVTFACGHHGEADERFDTRPLCPTCGSRDVAQVKARAPRFRGVATGPYCETKDLGPGVVDVAPGGPLILKGPD